MRAELKLLCFEAVGYLRLVCSMSTILLHRTHCAILYQRFSGGYTSLRIFSAFWSARLSAARISLSVHRSSIGWPTKEEHRINLQDSVYISTSRFKDYGSSSML